MHACIHAYIHWPPAYIHALTAGNKHIYTYVSLYSYTPLFFRTSQTIYYISLYLLHTHLIIAPPCIYYTPMYLLHTHLLLHPHVFTTPHTICYTSSIYYTPFYLLHPILVTKTHYLLHHIYSLYVTLFTTPSCIYYTPILFTTPHYLLYLTHLLLILLLFLLPVKRLSFHSISLVYNPKTYIYIYICISTYRF